MSNVIEVKVPDIGDFKEIPIIEILVKPGDSVALFIYYPYTDQRVLHAFTLDPQ